MRQMRSAGRKRGSLLAAALGFAFLGCVVGAEARVTTIVLGPPSFAFDGARFGEVGQYLSFEGKASGEIDPHDPLNKVIQDIDLAPRNAQGLVSYSTDISILTPVDPSAGNRTMLLNIVNRGPERLFGQRNGRARRRI